MRRAFSRAYFPEPDFAGNHRPRASRVNPQVDEPARWSGDAKDGGCRGEPRWTTISHPEVSE
jgi:hypothetical protein